MASPVSPSSPGGPGGPGDSGVSASAPTTGTAPPRPAAKTVPESTMQLPSVAQLEANYRIAAAAAAGTLHHEVVDAQLWDVLTSMVFLRLCGVFFVRTFFQPDEYFQALEPAWQLAFGPESGAWLTWEWKYQLRTSLHPVLFAGVYAAVDAIAGIMHIVGPLRALVIVAAPRIVQALFTAFCDYFVFRLAGHLYGHGHNASWAALWLCIVCPWQLYCGARTFSNGLETTLTVAALSYWPWQLLAGTVDAKPSVVFANGGTKRLRIALFLAATAVVLRPTNILIWLGLVTITVTRLTLDGPSSSSFLSAAVIARLGAESIGCGSIVLALSAVSDRLYYGIWTLPAYTFLDINLTQDVAVFYGRNDWHYYLSQGLPILTTTVLPFTLYGLYAALTASPGTADVVKMENKPSSSPDTAKDPALLCNARKALAFTAVSTIVVFSLTAHKEVRFISPLLPILLVLSAPHVASFYTNPPIPESEADKASRVELAESTHGPKTNIILTNKPVANTTTLRNKKLLGASLIVNAILATYLSLFHQPAALGVVDFLRDEYQRIHHDWLEVPAAELPSYDVYPDAFVRANELAKTQAVFSDGDGDELFALFLVPCHTTPWRSHLVYPGLRARALTCEPPLNTPPRSAERDAYLDENSRFYQEVVYRSALLKSGGTVPTDVAPPASLYLVDELWPLLAGENQPAGSTRRRGGEVPRYIVGFEGIEDVLTQFFASDDPLMGGADLGVRLPLQRAWTGWNGFFNEDWRRRGSIVVWDTGVYSNASHPDTERTFDE